MTFLFLNDFGHVNSLAQIEHFAKKVKFCVESIVLTLDTHRTLNTFFPFSNNSHQTILEIFIFLFLFC
jgi:hypothetical protein